MHGHCGQQTAPACGILQSAGWSVSGLVGHKTQQWLKIECLLLTPDYKACSGTALLFVEGGQLKLIVQQSGPALFEIMQIIRAPLRRGCG